MTTEEKDLLLKDLSARLPYNLRIRTHYEDDIYGDIILHKISGARVNDLYKIENCKPYLRPMSNMTEEEMDKLAEFHIWNDGEKIFPDCNCKLSDIVSAMNWLNKKMFDYRGLIEKGLALEAPEGMYN